MEFLVLIGIGLIVWFFFFKSDDSDNSTRNSSGSLKRNQNDTKHSTSEKTFNVSRNRIQSGSQSSKIKFQNSGFSSSENNTLKVVNCPNCGTKSRVTSAGNIRVTCPSCSNRFDVLKASLPDLATNLDGINDAFTGVPIDQSGVVHACSCGVFYQGASFELLQSENSSNCIACGKSNISLYSRTRQADPGKVGPRNYNPNSVTLRDYHKFINQVVTFEGLVHTVNVSKRGSDYAVMFENKSWAKGFKLVFFKGAVRKVGGPNFVKSLKGKHIKVRGLVIKHATFGYEIIINDRAMILEID